ncbi:P-loop containing nucleoside triphosphate hydrolase protein [Hysterangium stoloniferum]|nr:P-loop containing nucleoside triphosphate hydrolase protein [Hysterangium stoloniferum]
MMFCDDKEGWGPVSQDRDFDLTVCFEEGVLIPGILSLLLGVGFIRVCVLARRDPVPRNTRSCRVLYAKLLFLILAASCALASLLLGLTDLPQLRLPLSTAILYALALTLTPIITYLNHTRLPSSSTTLLLFWPIYVFEFLIWIRTNALLHVLSAKDVNLWLYCISTGLGVVAFILEIRGTEFTNGDEHEEVGENPIVKANIFSIWTFGWMTPLMKLGYSKYLTEEDMYALLPTDESERLGARLHVALQKYSSLWVALGAAYGGPFAVATVLKLTQDCLVFLQPQLLRLLLTYITDYQRARDLGMKPPSPYQGFAFAGLMFLSAMCQSILLHQYFQRVYETGLRIRAGLVTNVYRKALVLSSDERGARATGDIVNIMSVDTVKLQDLCTYGFIVISGPFQIMLAFISLYNLLGWPAFVGVAVMAGSLPVTVLLAKYAKTLQRQQMKNRDQRTRLMTESLSNIKRQGILIKLYGWESAFIQRILHVRNNLELKMLRKIGLVGAATSTLWVLIPILVAFTSFLAAALTSATPLTSDVIFPALSMFMLLQFPMAMFPNIITSVIEAMVSVKRLSSFLRAGELQPDVRKIVHKAGGLHEGDVVLEIEDGEFQWNRDQPESTLFGIDLTVKIGELVGVLGRVGSGKTSLLSAIIGEMHRTAGEVTLFGTIAYCPQTPWIMSATIRDNILFSHTYDEEFYEIVLDACALRQDLAILAKGDMTQVGEKGISLSGGQRARISLARAVYARADIYLLDDVLSAVDAHVARHIFDNVIGPTGILATKARILVTNTVAFLKHHDQLLFLRKGIILEKGTYDEILKDETKELHKLMYAFALFATYSYDSTGHSRIRDLQSGTSTPRADDETLAGTPPNEQEIALEGAAVSEATLDKQVFKRSFGKAAFAKVSKQLSAAKKDVAQAEHTERGRVKRTVYTAYMKAASVPGFALFIVAIIMQQACQLLSNITLQQWGEHNQKTGDNSDMIFYLIVYGIFSLLAITASTTASVTMLVMLALRSAKHLHNSMLLAVMRAPLSFFEQTPTGRTLNLFSRDTYVVDQILANVIANLFRTGSQICGIIVVLCSTFPVFLFVVPILGYFYRQIMIYYLATGRELKRLDATSRSPIFTSFSETLGGVSTIRAFGQESIFIRDNQHRIDRNQMCYLPAISVNRWLAIRLETVGNLLIFISATLACVALVTTGVNAGIVGLMISYGLNTTGALNWFVRSASEVEQNIVSVERILHQTNVSPEAPEHILDTLPHGPWPSKGSVEFQNYSMRYRPELDLVLRNISLSIKPKEKIGICGRTGSVVSFLLLALFRIIEPAHGTILIDGVDITTLGLNDLRSVISIIPQESDMFEGTLRENIDPVGIADDAAIWTALEQAYLKDYVQSLPEGLDSKVQEGGSSLSSGQRQLVCFARALLRKSKVLVLDEATSAIDLDTDKAVQDILRGPQFADTTILTIAHRLNTIIESDRVLVLNNGEIAEFDAPTALLATPDSMFASLAREAGVAPKETD